MKQRQQGSTSYPITFLMVDSSDHITPKTGLAPTVKISKSGAAFGDPAGAVSEVGYGWYALAGHATDRDTLGEFVLHATAAGADPADDRYVFVPWNPFDANQGLTNLDAAVSSRSTYAGADTAGTTTLLSRVPGTVQPQTGDAYARLGAPSGASVSADVAAVKTDTGGLRTDYTTARAGKLDNLDAAVTTRSTYAGGAVASVTADVGITQAAADKVWGSSARSLTDKAGFSLSAPGIQAIWDALASALSAAGSIGKRIVDYLDAAVSSRSTYAGGPVASVTAAVTVGTNNDKTGYALTSDYDAAKTAGDATAANQTTINSNVLSRLATAGYTAPDNAGIAAIKAKTDKLPASPASASDIPTATQNADALLKRDMGAVSGEAARSPLNALRFIRNKWSVSGSTLSVKKEDDATEAWSAALSTDESAQPITGSDPS